MSHATTSSQQQPSPTKQVGGNHYTQTAAHCPHCNGEIQHWDFYANAPGLVYSATKHITRHRVKNGKEDLLKAITEIQKIIAQEYPEPAEQVQRKVLRANGGEVTTYPGTGTGYGVARAPSDPGYTDFVLPASPRPKKAPVGLLRTAPQGLQGATSTLALLAASEGIVQVHDLDEYAADAALARASAYAAQRIDEDVPVGWVLEPCTAEVHGTWHFRKGSGGLWSTHLPSRSAALSALMAAKKLDDCQPAT